jgi:hypothetical protein
MVIIILMTIMIIIISGSSSSSSSIIYHSPTKKRFVALVSRPVPGAIIIHWIDGISLSFLDIVEFIKFDFAL